MARAKTPRKKKSATPDIPDGISRKYVGSTGPRTARLAIVGEAPGGDEEREGKPFVGYSGQFLRERAVKAGLLLDDIFITNVCHYRPPANKIEKFFSSFGSGKKNIANELVLEGVIELWKDLASLPNLTLIVPMGNVALWALTGKMLISKRRGSILKVEANLGLFSQIHQAFPEKFPEVAEHFKRIQGRKVVPCLHPAGVTRKFSLRPIFDFDLKRIRDESETREILLPQRQLFIDPPQALTYELVRKLMAAGHFTVDSECVGRRVYCIQYSCDPSWALVLRTDSSWKLAVHRWLLGCDAEKAFQNGTFDNWFIPLFGRMPIKNWTYDTMIAQRILYPDFDVGLDFQVSFYTREPYYKDEGKVWKEIEVADEKKVDTFLKYAGKDACCQEECRVAQMNEEFREDPCNLEILKHKMKMAHIAVEMEMDGWKIDTKIYKRIKDEVTNEVKTRQESLDKAILVHLNHILKTDPKMGPRALALMQKIAKCRLAKKKPDDYPWPVGFNINSTGEGNTVDEYVYGIRGFKPIYDKDTKKRTTDEEALKEIYGQSGDPIILMIVKQRQSIKLLGTELSVLLDNHDRTYFSINPARTKSLRWAFTSTILGHGGNGQAWHPRAKEMVVADDGFVLVNCDLSQVEDRIVSRIAGIQSKVLAFEQGLDIHSLTASQIFGGTIEEIRAEHKAKESEGKQGPRRYLGKQSNHAFNYGLGPIKFAKHINKDADETGVRITDSEAKRIRLKHLATYPELEWYWDDIAAQARSNRYLVNPFGWKRIIYGPLTDEFLRELYSWIPQSTAPHIIDLGMLAIREHLGKRTRIRFMLHGHDSITMQVPQNEASDLVPEIIKLMTIPFEVAGHEMIVPVDGKIGKNMKEMKG